MNNILILMSIFSTLVGMNSQETNQIKVISPSEFREATASKSIQLVDVRTANEFESGHISGAVNIDFFKTNEFDEAFNKLNKKAPVYVYCRSGVRSNKTAKKLVALGFTEIYDLKGGYLNWK